jgi:hypothetical protein
MTHARGFLERLPAAGAPVLLMALAMAAALGGCLGERLAGSTTTGNTGKGTISGRVLNAKGEGVANARVRVVSVDHNPGPGGAGAGEIADVVLTSKEGTFRTDSLADGLYNLLDEKAGELSFQDSVAVDGDSPALAGDDVLRPPGSLSGVVRLQPGHDSRTIFLILMGTTTLVLPMDSVGNFRLNNLAEGEYRLRILSTLDAYKPLDTVVAIFSGIQGILRDTLRLEYKAPAGEIPVVGSLRVAYDSARIAATLTWRKTDPASTVSYRVYRRQGESAYVKLNQAPLADTVFVDDWSAGLFPGNHYEYAVTVVDPRGDEGRKTEATSLDPGVRYRIDTRIPAGICGKGCQVEFDLDSAGDVYVSRPDGALVRYRSNGTITQNKDPHSEFFDSRPIAADAAGGSVYILYRDPWRIGKVDSAGKSVWLNPLPFQWSLSLTLERGGDSLYVWNSQEGVMVYLDLNGRILGQDTVMRLLDWPETLSAIRYKRGVGFFFTNYETIRLLDREGRLLAEWNPERRGSMFDLDRDAAGRWFLSWEEGVVDVFSPDRILLGSILTGLPGHVLKVRNDSPFMGTEDFFQLLKIDPGF